MWWTKDIEVDEEPSTIRLAVIFGGVGFILFGVGYVLKQAWAIGDDFHDSEDSE